MTKARNIADLLDANGDVKSGSLDNVPAVDLTNLSASNLTSGSIPDARVPASAVSQHATSFDDNKLVNDISTLAIRQASNENKGAYNTNSMYVDVFQDSTGVTGLTNVQRSSDEYMSSVSQGSATEFDYNGASPKAKIKTSNMTGTNDTYFEIDNDGDSSRTGTKYVIPSISLSGNNYYMHNSGNTGTNAWSIYDFQSVKLFGGSLKIGKVNTWADIKTFRFRYSTDNNTYHDWDMSNTSSGGVAYWSNGNGSSGGVWQSGTSGGNIVTSQHSTGAIYGSIATVNGVPNINARYLQVMYIDEYSGTQDNACGLGMFAPYEIPLVANATGSFTSNNITAPSSTSKMGAIITYQNQAGTNALNTDIVLKLSADGGSNFSTATLTAMPDFASGIKMAKVNDLSVTAGTQLKYKIEFANQSSGSKEARIRGVSLQY